MKRCLDYLVEYEKIVVVITLFLVFALFWQLKIKNACLEQATDFSQIQTSDIVANHAEWSSDAERNVAGTWEMSVRKRNGTQTWTLKLKQNGEHLTGIINSEGGDLNVAGTIKGQTVNLSAKRFGITVDFPAVLNADETMTGEMRVLSVNRKWTARNLR